MSTIPTNSKQAPSALPEERPDFYVTGGTLPASATSYVARAADTLLLDALKRGEFCYVLNTRQMGKSSLMARTASQLLHSGIATAVLDLTAGGRNLTVDQWYHGLLERVGQQLGLRTEMRAFARDNKELGPLPRFMEALAQVALPALPGPLVIFIDEIDAVRSLPFATDELFAGIRELYNRRTTDPELNRLTFCLLGVATPADLIRDTRTTPFNIGTRISLDDFTPVEAAPLAQGMAGSQAVLDRVLSWTGGHPYLTQRLCRAIAEEPKNIAPSDVDALCETLFLAHGARDTEDNLSFVRDRVLRSEHDIAALLTLYGRILRGRPVVSDDPADPLASALKLSGLVKADPRGNLIVRNKIYARVFDKSWVTENLPGSELRRQRQAFWRGAIRTGSIAAVIIAIIGTLASIATRASHEAQRQEGKARQEATQFEKLLYVSDMQNAQTAWDSSNLGRLRELLAQTQSSPERGFEWGYWNHLAYPPGDVVNPGDGPLVACAITKDGSRLLTAGGNGMLRLWDTRTLRQLLSVHYPGKTPQGNVGFSHDGSQFTAGDLDGGVATFSTDTGKMLFCLKPTATAGFTSDISPDFKTVLDFTPGVGTKIVRIDRGKTIGFVPDRGEGAGDAYAHSDSKFFWFGDKPFDASIYSAETGVRICALQLRGAIRQSTGISGSFADNDQHLVTTSFPVRSVDLWDTRTGRLTCHLTDISQPEGKGEAFAVADPNLPLVVVEDGERMREYSTDTGQKTLDVSFPDALKNFSPRSFSGDGRFLGFFGTNGGVFLFDCKTGTCSADFLGHTEAVTDMALSPNGRQFFSVANDGTLRRGSASQTARSGWQTIRFPADPARYGIQILPGRQRAITVGNPTTRLWNISGDCATPMSVLSASCNGHFAISPPFYPLEMLPSGLTSVFDLRNGRCVGKAIDNEFGLDQPPISSDGQRLATVSKSGMVEIFDVRSGALLWSRKSDNNVVGWMQFSPSDRLVASVGGEGVIDVWEARSGRKIAALTKGPESIITVTILPGDKRVVSRTNNEMDCWDIGTGRCLWAATMLFGGFRISCSPDGRRILTGSVSGAVNMLDAQTGDLLLTVPCKTNSRSIPQFSPDGNTLEFTDYAGGYIDYVADMTIRHNPAAQ